MPTSQGYSRRQLLRSGCGFGYLALASLITEKAWSDARPAAGPDAQPGGPLAPRLPHYPPRAKRVIFMFMQGGPSHVDTFDYKPELKALAGKNPAAGRQRKKQKRPLLPSPWKFRQHGQCGLPISELFPHLARHADDLCMLNGMHTDSSAHPQATIMLHTGSINFVRPSLGAWVLYGLGSENQDLPGFVTINPLDRLGGAQNYGSSFLPASYQGTRVTAGGTPIANINNALPSREDQRQHLDLVQSMNREYLRRTGTDSQLEAVIESYELAFRMQDAVPQVMNPATETAATRQRYGLDDKATRAFGTQCLMARRLAEAGVRFIEITKPGWDQHNRLREALPNNCRAVDKPIAALIQDLKQRGMLDETLLVWGGEFGRTPTDQGNGDGRQHNARGFSMWLAGGGVRGGLRYGATDPTGLAAVEDKIHTHDLHATILHLLGLDHKRLTYRHAGRDFRLTDVHGHVVQDLLA